MKNISILIVLVINSTLLFSQSAKKYTLEECVEIALENNRNIKQQLLNKKQRELAYDQARADLLPNLNASVGQNFIFGRSIGLDNTYQNVNSQQTSFSIGSNITIFDGLKMKYNIDARKTEVFISQADLERIKDDIEISVSTAFMQVLMNKELLIVAEDQIELGNENFLRLEELVNSGKVARGELYELEAQLAKEEFNRVQAYNNLKLSLLDLAQIMELEEFEEFDITANDDIELQTKGEIPLSPTVAYESALLVRPEILVAQYRVDANEKEISIAKSAYFPSLSFGASMGTGYYHMGGANNDLFRNQLRNNISTSLGFSLQIPIFNKFQVRNSVKNAEIALQNSIIEVDKTKLELRKRIEQAYYNAVGAKSRWEAAQVAERASKESYRFVEEKYESGRANSYELSQAKNSLANVLSDGIQAKYEYIFRMKILELLKN